MSERHERTASLCAGMMASLLVTGISLLTSQVIAQPHFPPGDISIATQLKEVQRGTIDGRDYLTLNIGGHEVGPSSCRSNVLRMDTSGDAGAARQKEIEAIAISAMLTATSVMIVVPLELDQCVDGKPTFKDLYPLSASLQ